MIVVDPRYVLLEFMLKNRDIEFVNETHLLCELYSYLRNKGNWLVYPEYPIKMYGSKKAIDLVLLGIRNQKPRCYIEIKHGSFNENKINKDIRKMKYSRRDIHKIMFGYFDNPVNFYSLLSSLNYKAVKEGSITVLMMLKGGVNGFPVILRDSNLKRKLKKLLKLENLEELKYGLNLFVSDSLMVTNLSIGRILNAKTKLKKQFEDISLFIITSRMVSNRKRLVGVLKASTEKILVYRDRASPIEIQKLYPRKRKIELKYIQEKGIYL